MDPVARSSFVLQPLTMAELHLVRIWVQCRRAGGQPQLHVVFVVPRLRMHERRVTFVGSEQITLGQGWALVRALSFGRDEHDLPSYPSARSVSAALAPAKPPPTITNAIPGHLTCWVHQCQRLRTASGSATNQPTVPDMRRGVGEGGHLVHDYPQPSPIVAVDQSARKEGSRLSGALACSSATSSCSISRCFAERRPVRRRHHVDSRQTLQHRDLEPGRARDDEVGGKACQLTAAIGSVSRGLGVGGKRPISWLVMSFSAARVRRPPSNPPTQYGSARSPSSASSTSSGDVSSSRYQSHVSSATLARSTGSTTTASGPAARPRLRPPRRARCRRHRRRSPSPALPGTAAPPALRCASTRTPRRRRDRPRTWRCLLREATGTSSPRRGSPG